MATKADRAHWESVADAWTAWARASHDAFWAYRDGFATFLGPGHGRALEVGCGEGRVSRLLREMGYHVTATDPVATLVGAARAEASADVYAVAPAGELPFTDHAFDLVLAYNVLMDVDSMPAAVVEMARVLAPGGEMVISLVHPFTDRGRFASEGDSAPFVVEGSYFGRVRFDGVDERDGMRMHFAGWSQPLEAYAAALTAAGLAITALSEPRPSPGAPERWSRLPQFLWLKARALRA